MSDTLFIYPAWKVNPSIKALTTTRQGKGYSSAPFNQCNYGNIASAENPNGDHPQSVIFNRQELILSAQLPSAPLWLKQVHGVDIIEFNSNKNTIETPIADAAITEQKNTILAILTADCLPVLFANKNATQIAAAHAGWKGLLNGVLENTLKKFNTDCSNIYVNLGPAAGANYYEVGDEVRQHFIAYSTEAELAFIPTRPGHWLMNLYLLARQRLLAAGILAENITGGEYCTISQPELFYSYRRDGQTGRMASLIWME